MNWFLFFVAYMAAGAAMVWFARSKVRAAQSAAPQGLTPPGQYESFGAYVLEALGYAGLIRALAETKLSSQFAEGYLGRVWMIVEPLLMAGIYTLVFGFGLRAGRGVESFVVWLLIGQTFFRFAQRATLAGSTSLLRSQALLGTYGFPRIILPAAEWVRAFTQFIPGFIIVLIALPLGGIWPTTAWLMLPLIAIGLAVFSFGSALILARLSFLFPDVAHLLDVIFRLLFFASFVFFPASIFSDRGEVGQLIFDLLPINPFYCFIHLARWSLMDFDNGHLTTTTISAVVWLIVITVCGSYVFYKGEDSYGPAKRKAQAK